jgi:hypothetical protein
MTTHQALHPKDPKDVESRHLNPGNSTVMPPFDHMADHPLGVHNQSAGRYAAAAGATSPGGDPLPPNSITPGVPLGVHPWMCPGI